MKVLPSNSTHKVPQRHTNQSTFSCSHSSQSIKHMGHMRTLNHGAMHFIAKSWHVVQVELVPTRHHSLAIDLAGCLSAGVCNELTVDEHEDDFGHDAQRRESLKGKLIPDSIRKNVSPDNTWAKRVDPNLVSGVVPLGDTAHEAQNAICACINAGDFTKAMV